MIIVIGYQYSYLVIPVEFKDYGDWLEEKPRSLGEIMHYSDALIKAYEEDFYGGETPEETLALWVEAVKDDDLEKASLYFLVDARTEALEGIKISRENNVLPRIISDIENGGVMHVTDTSNGASFDTSTSEEVKETGRPGFNFTFTKNPYTNVWKLDEF